MNFIRRILEWISYDEVRAYKNAWKQIAIQSEKNKCKIILNREDK
jgi:hypothetical protein